MKPKNDNPNEVSSSEDIFNRLKLSILNTDPVTFCENNLTVDSKPFRLRGNGWKPFIDIYRYVGMKALEPTSLPVVLVKGRQVGASIMAGNLEMYWAGSGLYGTCGRPPVRILHCYPQLDMAAIYTKTKLNPIITQSVQVKDKNGKTKGIMETKITNTDSLYFKEFENGNTVCVDSIGIDGDRVRGRTSDIIVFDEFQDMFKRAVLNTKELLTQSQYGRLGAGVELYLGTPKSKDSFYYNVWDSSTQHYYYLGCEHCNQYFPLYTPGSDEWETIWIEDYIVKCTFCDHKQDKREAAERGKWISKKDESKCQYIGFHINQLYVPRFNKQVILSKKPGINPASDEIKWRNEVLGEFYSGEGTTITAEEIKEKCGDYKRFFRKFITVEECSRDRCAYLGADWGKKTDTSISGRSFSTVVILKKEGPQLFSISFATKLQRNDREYKMQLMDELMTRYNIKHAVGDIGFAYDFMKDLSQKYGDRFLASEASGNRILGRIKFYEKEDPSTIRFDKNKLIEEIFGLLKKGAIRFPFGEWEKLAWLVTHCSSMIQNTKMDRTGNISTTYEKGPTPNDGLMALINAYLAYKYDSTNGFKDNNSSVENYAGEKKCNALGVYLPNMRLTK